MIGFCAIANLKITANNKEVNGLSVERRKIADLTKAPWNPRRITTEQQAALQRSLAEFGTVEPIVVNKRTGNVVGGHQRLDALLAIGETETDVLVGEWSEPQEKALNVALNKIHGEWDEALLADLLTELQNTDIDIGLTGFSTEEIERLLFKEFEGETDPDDVPDESQVETRCKLGDLWQLGEHRLLCGDSTNSAHIELLMNGTMVDMIFIDPPYSVNYEDSKEHTKSKTRKFSKIHGDNFTTEECAEKIWRPAFRNLYEVAREHCSFYMTMCQGGDHMKMMMAMDENWQIKHEIIWVKNAPVFSMGRLDYDYKHEPILYGWKKNHKFYGAGEFKNSVWEIDKPIRSDEHPTMKPVAVVANALQNSSVTGDNVIDVFLGSGTTLIACEQLGRRCFGMELEPHYCDVIIARWEKFTGKTATLLSQDRA